MKILLYQTKKGTEINLYEGNGISQIITHNNIGNEIEISESEYKLLVHLDKNGEHIKNGNINEENLVIKGLALLLITGNKLKPLI